MTYYSIVLFNTHLIIHVCIIENRAYIGVPIVMWSLFAKSASPYHNEGFINFSLVIVCYIARTDDGLEIQFQVSEIVIKHMLCVMY